jgi:hypothetical protein
MLLSFATTLETLLKAIAPQSELGEFVPLSPLLAPLSDVVYCTAGMRLEPGFIVFRYTFLLLGWTSASHWIIRRF